MAWVFRRDVTGPKGLTGDPGANAPTIRLADSGRFYDRTRYSLGAAPTIPAGARGLSPSGAGVSTFLSDVHAVEESTTVSGIWLQGAQGKFFVDSLGVGLVRGSYG